MVNLLCGQKYVSQGYSVSGTNRDHRLLSVVTGRRPDVLSQLNHVHLGTMVINHSGAKAPSRFISHSPHVT